MIEKCQNIQCSTACWVWGCIVTVRVPMSTIESAYNGHVSVRSGQCSAESPFLLHHGQLCVCVLLTWKIDGSRIYYRKKANWQRQCDFMKPFGMKGSQYFAIGPGIVCFTLRDLGPILLPFFVLFGYHCILKFATQRKEVPAG